MKDFQVVSSLTQLKALVAGLYGRIDALATAPTPTVDFAVDMFDRQDQGTLGDYWEPNGFGILNGRAVLVEGSTALNTILTAIASTNIFFVFGPSQPTQTLTGIIRMHNFGWDTIISSVYAGNITSPDYTCEIIASVPPKTIGEQLPDQTTSVSYSTGAGGSGYSTRSVIIDGGVADSLATNFGVCIADARNNSTGVCVSAGELPGASAAASSTTQESINPPVTYSAASNTPGGVICDVRYGNANASKQLLQQEIVSAAQSTSTLVSTSITVVPATYGVASLGYNSVRVRNDGLITTFTVNGIVVSSGVSKTVARKDRTRAGIASSQRNAAAVADLYPALSVGGITSFKVWRNDIPEPPSETGHGTLVNGRWQYTDKYHTPVVDEDGNIVRNEDGTVASYVYDPEA